MECPRCQTSLVDVPTVQLPHIDVCPHGHGLWLDAADALLLVPQATSAAAADSDIGPDRLATVGCPHCGHPLDQARIGEEAVLLCASCRGLWCPHGVLTRLDGETGTRKPAVDERAWYARARRLHTARGGSPSPRRRMTLSADVLFWMTLVGFALFAVTVVVWETLRQFMLHGRWAQPPDQVFGLLLAGVIGGIALCVAGIRLHRRTRLIADTPTSTVRALALGPVEIAGRAQPSGVLQVSPFGGMPCVFFFYRVEERRKSGKSEKWVTIARGQSDQPFFLRDETGAVMVIPRGADLLMEPRATYTNAGSAELPPTVLAGLARLGIDSRGSLGGPALRCREGFILPHESIYVFGTAYEQAAAAASDNAARLFIGHASDGDFFISEGTEQELLSRLRWKAAACVYGGPIVALASLWGILTGYVALPR